MDFTYKKPEYQSKLFEICEQEKLQQLNKTTEQQELPGRVQTKRKEYAKKVREEFKPRIDEEKAKQIQENSKRIKRTNFLTPIFQSMDYGIETAETLRKIGQQYLDYCKSHKALSTSTNQGGSLSFMAPSSHHKSYQTSPKNRPEQQSKMSHESYMTGNASQTSKLCPPLSNKSTAEHEYQAHQARHIQYLLNKYSRTQNHPQERIDNFG